MEQTRFCLKLLLIVPHGGGAVIDRVHCRIRGRADRCYGLALAHLIVSRQPFTPHAAFLDQLGEHVTQIGNHERVNVGTLRKFLRKRRETHASLALPSSLFYVWKDHQVFKVQRP